jgi:hypothetical protein
MKLTVQDKEQLAKIAKKEPVVQRLIDELDSFKTDPLKRFFAASKMLGDAFAQEIEDYLSKDKKKSLLETEDKTFERLASLLKDNDKFITGMNRSKDIIYPDEAVPSKKKKKEETEESLPI